MRRRYGPLIGYGIFFHLLELLRAEESRSLDATDPLLHEDLAQEWGMQVTEIEPILRFAIEQAHLFDYLDASCTRFHSTGFDERVGKAGSKNKDLSEMRRRAGLKGAQKRWQNMANDAKIANEISHSTGAQTLVSEGQENGRMPANMANMAIATEENRIEENLNKENKGQPQESFDADSKSRRHIESNEERERRLAADFVYPHDSWPEAKGEIKQLLDAIAERRDKFLIKHNELAHVFRLYNGYGFERVLTAINALPSHWAGTGEQIEEKITGKQKDSKSQRRSSSKIAVAADPGYHNQEGDAY
jgi:hypothetical protein